MPRTVKGTGHCVFLHLPRGDEEAAAFFCGTGLTRHRAAAFSEFSIRPAQGRGGEVRREALTRRRFGLGRLGEKRHVARVALQLAR